MRHTWRLRHTHGAVCIMAACHMTTPAVAFPDTVLPSEAVGCALGRSHLSRNCLLGQSMMSDAKQETKWNMRAAHPTHQQQVHNVQPTPTWSSHTQATRQSHFSHTQVTHYSTQVTHLCGAG